MSEELSKEQTEAYDAIQQWLKEEEKQEFHLGGFAGTGKTFLLQYLVNEYSKRIHCCAPTGKAASVLQKKMPTKRVTTIHSALYSPIEPDSETLRQLMEKRKEAIGEGENVDALDERIEEEKKELAAKKLTFQSKASDIIRGDLVVIDEASMVTKDMRRDLAATGGKILFVGDPGQLPPVGDGGWFLKEPFDYVLEDVHRQAMDSPIIRLSMDIRFDCINRNDYQFEDCKCVTRSSVSEEEWLAANQVITGRNVSRRQINRFYRKRKWKDRGADLSVFPVAGDKLICLKNEYRHQTFFVNGIQAFAINDAARNKEMDLLSLDLLYEDKEIMEVSVDTFPFSVHYNEHVTELPWQLTRHLRKFDYAYAITVHKSQGSEWDSVIVADDYMNAGDKEFRRRWLYTAVTRAKKKLIWIDD